MFAVSKPLSLASGFRMWMRDLLRTRGLFCSAAEIVRQGFYLARDYTPARRRLRFGDLSYDLDHAGVNTTWANVTLRTRLLEIFTRGQYQPSDPELFHEILHQLPSNFRGFTFIDMGSGKGRALLMASQHGFQRVMGVEIIPELHRVAKRNIQALLNEAQLDADVRSYCVDARGFEFPIAPSVIYFFNPFPEDVLRTVLANLERSVRESPRSIWVIYHNLIHAGVFEEQRWMEKVTSTHQYAIYRSEGERGLNSKKRSPENTS